jgi:integrase
MSLPDYTHRAERNRDRLPAQVADRIGADTPLNTQIAWGARRSRYASWCAQTGREPLPAAGPQLAQYLEYLHGQGLKTSSLDAHLASLAAVSRLWAQSEAARREHAPADPPAQPDLTPATTYINGLRRHDERTQSASALYPRDIQAIVDAIPPHSRTYLRDRALILLAFALGRPGAHITALDLEDITDTDNGIAVILPAGPRSSSGEYDQVHLPAATRERYCPVAAVRAWRDALAERDHHSGALFIRIDRTGQLGVQAWSAARRRSHDDGRITLQTLRHIVLRHAAAANLTSPPGASRGSISPHSLRRGFVMSAFDRGADPVAIARHAGFTDTSMQLGRYVEPATGWDRNPAAGLFDTPEAADPP